MEKQKSDETKLRKILDISKQEKIPYQPIKWISFHPDGAYATCALSLLIEEFYSEN